MSWITILVVVFQKHLSYTHNTFCGVIVIFVENGLGSPSSNPKWDFAFHCTLKSFQKPQNHFFSFINNVIYFPKPVYEQDMGHGQFYKRGLTGFNYRLE